MKCPFCNKTDLKVLETRECPDNVTRRRKECLGCKRRFTTYEHIDLSPLMVIKKDGSRQEFDREKISRGIAKACEKRDIKEEQIFDITEQIIAKVKSLDTREIKSTRVGLYVLNKLKKLDKVAYMRFASVYRDFNDIEHFENEISKIQKK